MNASISRSRSTISRTATRLHPSGRQTLGHFPPQQGADFIPHDPVQNPPRLLGVYAVDIDCMRMEKCLLNLRLGDRVEDDPIRLRIRFSSASLRCQAIASPSRSKSVARYILSLVLASFFNSLALGFAFQRAARCRSGKTVRIRTQADLGVRGTRLGDGKTLVVYADVQRFNRTKIRIQDVGDRHGVIQRRRFLPPLVVEQRQLIRDRSSLPEQEGALHFIELQLGGTPQPSQYAPEDWVGSTTSIFSRPGAAGAGRQQETLRDAIARAPDAFLGPDHVARYGADPALLVKILDTGERLVVHFHPDRDFASRHLGSRYGKTEAWIILEARPDSCVYLGFKRRRGSRGHPALGRGQDTAAILGSLNKVPVAAGDTWLVPAGVPHAIGAGITLVELQEPTDFSILLEWPASLSTAGGGSPGPGV